MGQPRPKEDRPAAQPGQFDALLQRELGQQPIRFSRHAQDRLRAGGNALNDGDVARLTSAVDKAAAKGSRDTLVLMDNTAFIVSVKNRTVITAVTGQRRQEDVFTNIDSAVIT